MIVNCVIVYKTVTNIILHQSHNCKVQFYKILQTVPLLAILVTGSAGGVFIVTL
jgi:hypothetical protein